MEDSREIQFREIQKIVDACIQHDYKTMVDAFSLKKEYLHLIYTDVGLRLLASVVIAAFVYFALDYPMAIKKVIMVLVFAPVAGMACYYTAKMKLKIEVAACISSFYILLSIVVMSAMIIALQSV